MVRYAAVPFTASSGVDITETIGRTKNNSKIVIRTEIAINKTTVFPMSCAACFLFFAPMACPILTVVPIASPTIMTVSICITCEPTETAVVLATPSNCPTINRSAIPYNVCRKYESKYGSENKITFLNTLPVVRFFSNVLDPFLVNLLLYYKLCHSHEVKIKKFTAAIISRSSQAALLFCTQHFLKEQAMHMHGLFFAKKRGVAIIYRHL